MRYNLFIRRYQCPHKGHQAIFNSYLEKGEPICIAIRDVAPDEKNPFTAKEVLHLLYKLYGNNKLVKIIIIPDIASVNYGRGVGYDVKEIKVTEQIANISATDIRNQIAEGKEDWKELVDEKIHIAMKRMLGV